MFFNRPDFDLATAVVPTFSVVPEGEMLNDLRRDYQAMTGMIFGDAPAFNAVIDKTVELESILNSVPHKDCTDNV